VKRLSQAGGAKTLKAGIGDWFEDNGGITTNRRGKSWEISPNLTRHEAMLTADYASAEYAC